MACGYMLLALAAAVRITEKQMDTSGLILADGLRGPSGQDKAGAELSHHRSELDEDGFREEETERQEVTGEGLGGHFEDGLQRHPFRPDLRTPKTHHEGLREKAKGGEFHDQGAGPTEMHLDEDSLREEQAHQATAHVHGLEVTSLSEMETGGTDAHRAAKDFAKVRSPEETAGPLEQHGRWWLIFALCINLVCLAMCLFIYAFCFSARNEGSDQLVSNYIEKVSHQDLPRPRGSRRSHNRKPSRHQTTKTHLGHGEESSDDSSLPAVCISRSAPVTPAHRQSSEKQKQARFGEHGETTGRTGSAPRRHDTGSSSGSRHGHRHDTGGSTSTVHHLEVPHPE